MRTLHWPLTVAAILVMLSSLADAVPRKKSAEPRPATQPSSNPNILARVKLPAPVEATSIGGGGKYLILHLKKLQMLAVFDVAQCKVLKYLPMPSADLVFTSSEDKLFVGLKDLKLIQRWDLGKLELEATIPAPEGGIANMAAAAHAVGPLLLTGDKRFWQPDPTTLQATRVPSKNWGTEGAAWGPANIHVSYDGIAAVASGGGWAGFEFASIAGGVITDMQVGGIFNGDTSVAGNGALVFCGGGTILRSDLSSKVSGIDGQAFPADDSAFSLAFVKRGKAAPTLTLFSNSDPRPLITLNDVPEVAENLKLPIAQRVHLIPSQKVLILLGAGADELIVRNFDVLEQLAASGNDYLFVETSPILIAQRGTDYSYAIKIRSKRDGTQSELQAGPPGMKLDADGTLRWSVPMTFADSSASVIIKINDSAGQTIFQAFAIRITGGPSPSPAAASATSTPAPATPAPATQPAATQAGGGAPVRIKLVEPFAEFHQANGGHNLVFFEKGAKRLVIYESQTGKELGAIPVAADDMQFACGRDSIIVALPALKILQRYDLKTRQRTKTAPIPDPRPLRKIKMGSNSAGPAFLYFGGELVAIDGTTLATVQHRGSFPPGDLDRSFNYRVSADGFTVVCWDPYESPTGYSIARMKDGVVRAIGSEDSFSMANRQFTPTADGSLILYETKIFNAKGHAVASAVEGYNNYIPTSDPRFFIAVRNRDGKKSIAICTTNERRIVTELDQVPEIGDGDASEPRAIFLSDGNNVVLLPASNDEIQIRKLHLSAVAGTNNKSPDIKSSGAKDGASAPVVVSLPPAEVVVGSTYTYQIQLLPESAATYKIESAPEGLRVSATGKVTWKPAQRPVGGTVSVILTIVDASGREIPHSFDISVIRSQPPSTDANPKTGEIVKLDDHRIELPPSEYRYLPGLAGHALILSGNQLAIVAPDGLSIQKTLTLPRSYTTIGERKVALCQEPRSIDIIDKTTLTVTHSRAIAFNELLDLKLHPTLPISYVSYTQAGEMPRHHFLIFEEATAEARTDDNWIGQWLEISPSGSFLLTGFQETYQKGHDIIDNPDRIWIVPTYGSIDWMARYDLNRDTGLPVRVAHREKVGGNGVGLRLSLDGERATYLSHGGYPDISHNLGGWNPTDLSKLPVAYVTNEIASTTDLAFHPILPLVACYGKGTVTVFDRETGAKQEGRVNDTEIPGEPIERVYFSPDGRSILLQTTVNSIKYLCRIPLKLSTDEQKQVGTLPRPDKPLREQRRDGNDQERPRKLPESMANADELRRPAHGARHV